MTSAPSSPDSDSSAQDQLFKAEQLQILAQHTKSGAFASLLTATLFCYVLIGQVRSDVLFTWMTIVCLLAFFRRPGTHAILEKMVTINLWHFIRLGNGVAGVTWGVAAFYLFPADSLLHQAFHALLIGGLVAGGIAFYAVDLPSYICLVVPTITPLIIRHFTLSDSVHRMMSYLVLYYMLLMIITTKKSNKLAIKNIKLGQQNRKLVGELQKEQQETQAINHQLAQEIDERKEIEQELSSYRDHLEKLVEQRTEDLQSEIKIRRHSEEQLEHQAYHDALTGLPNRVFLKERLERSMKRALRSEKKLALLFMDLNNFKNVNDSMGHNAGDQLLQEVAKRLKSCCREEETVARFSGDEFMIIIENVEQGVEEVFSFCTRILKTLAKPQRIAENDLQISASIGISFFPDDAGDVETLIRNSDMAMYKAKADPKQNIALFTQNMDDEMQLRVTMERELNQAVLHREFVLHFQPKIDIRTGTIAGAEALIRWQKPDAGLVPPNLFIPVAEASGLIHPMGEWALEESCRQAKKWVEAGFSDFNMAVNISANQFQRFNLPEKVRQILAEIELPPANLTLEITENIVMEDVESAIRVMDSLAVQGVGIAIDDFGTGYSSLSYLKRFPINILKIDRSFVQELPYNEDDMVIASTIIDLAHNMGATVVAEGVETEEQLQVMKEHQCEEVQGYYYSPPLPAEEFFNLLSQGLEENSGA